MDVKNLKREINLFEIYLQTEKRYSEHTVSYYIYSLKQLKDFIFMSKDSFLNKKSVCQWIYFLYEKGLKPQSINKKLVVIRSFIRFLSIKKNDTLNSIKDIYKLKESSLLPKFIPEQKIENTINGYKFQDNFIGYRDKLVLALFYLTGIRISELIKITYEHIDLCRSTIKIIGKGRKERLVPIVDGIKELIKSYTFHRYSYFKSSNDSLIINNKGVSANDQFIRKLVKKHTDGQTPHVLRHSFATALINNGANILSIKDLLGHESVASTQIYTKINYKKLIDVHKSCHPREKE